MSNPPIEFFRHNIKKYSHLLAESLDNNIISTGENCAEVERLLKQLCYTEYALTLSSCTAGLFLLLKWIGVGNDPKYNTDYVIVPNMTFVATANVVEHCNAVPLFCDVDNQGLMDLDKLVELLGKLASEDIKPKVVIPVHLYGKMVDMEKLSRISKVYDFNIIEDCAHSLEAYKLWNEEKKIIYPGTLSSGAAFSFYATKNVTCGEGGAIVTNSKSCYEYIYSQRMHGMSASAIDRLRDYKHWDMAIPGYKYNLDDIRASLLIPQLERVNLNSDHVRRIFIAYMYDNGIKWSDKCRRVHIHPYSSDNALHLYPILIHERDTFIEYMKFHNIGVTVNYRPLSEIEYYKKKYPNRSKFCPNSIRLGESLVSIPMYPTLTDSEIDTIILRINQYLN